MLREVLEGGQREVLRELLREFLEELRELIEVIEGVEGLIAEDRLKGE